MISILDPNQPDQPFPPLEMAEVEPNGLLAVGGDLSTQRLLNAYRHGIFPWYSEGQPILWWSPNPRMVLFPAQLRVSRSLKKAIRNRSFEITFDNRFDAVISACSRPRKGDPGTWITPEMQAAYSRLHAQGHAHSIEVWQRGQLVGGLYGIALGRVFFGESMFSWVSNASKIALVALCSSAIDWGIELIDCQVYTDHLLSMGAEEIIRESFQEQLRRCCGEESIGSCWNSPQAER
jgi:leucyl/phenylalanyl-tRNA--protein transferase